jgi:hypothetical protein
MGWRRNQLTKSMVSCMSPEDQAFYNPAEPGVHQPYAEDHHPSVKTDKRERDEQRQFANWCLLHHYPFVWHATHKRSTANVGCPDFIVGVNKLTLWIKFKRAGEHLTPDQEAFRGRLYEVGITLYVCFSAAEAIALTRQHDHNEQ